MGQLGTVGKPYDAAIGVTYTSQYDVFTVRAGYLDLDEHRPGNAAGQIAHRRVRPCNRERVKTASKSFTQYSSV